MRVPVIAHILLLPHPAHRERLLAPGAPCAWYGIAREKWRTGWMVRPDHYLVDDDPTDWVVRRFINGPVGGQMYLRLAWDGAEVCEGTDRLGRVLVTLLLGPVARIHAAALGLEIAVLLGHEPGMDSAVALARLRSIVAPLGTLVLLDADGRDVAP